MKAYHNISYIFLSGNSRLIVIVFSSLKLSGISYEPTFSNMRYALKNGYAELRGIIKRRFIEVNYVIHKAYSLLSAPNLQHRCFGGNYITTGQLRRENLSGKGN